MKRRRIREIVADVLAVEEGDEPRPEEVTVTAGRERAPDVVRLGMVWGDVLGPSKRDVLQQLLALCGWREEWPGLTGDERWLLNRGKPFCAIARSQGRGDLWLWEHLREPVALPQEARRG